MNIIWSAAMRKVTGREWKHDLTQTFIVPMLVLVSSLSSLHCCRGWCVWSCLCSCAGGCPAMSSSLSSSSLCVYLRRPCPPWYCCRCWCCSRNCHCCFYEILVFDGVLEVLVSLALTACQGSEPLTQLNTYPLRGNGPWPLRALQLTLKSPSGIHNTPRGHFH